MKNAVLLILLLFLFFMPLQNWEGLQKSATDDETIEQAIARLIAVHESDSESHLGANESLAAHKAADVIDHPQQSIVADKEVFGLYNEVGDFLDLLGWEQDVGTITTDGGPAVIFSLFSQTAVYCFRSMPFTFTLPYPSKDLLYRFKLSMNGAQNSDGQLKVFWSENADPADSDRVEFVKDGTVYYFRIYVGGSKVHEYSLQSGGEFDSFVGVYFNSVNESIDLFVDGVEVSSYDSADWHDLIFPTLAIDATRSSNTSIGGSIRLWSAKYTLFTD